MRYLAISDAGQNVLGGLVMATAGFVGGYLLHRMSKRQARERATKGAEPGSNAPPTSPPRGRRSPLADMAERAKRLPK